MKNVLKIQRFCFWNSNPLLWIWADMSWQKSELTVPIRTEQFGNITAWLVIEKSESVQKQFFIFALREYPISFNNFKRHHWTHSSQRTNHFSCQQRQLLIDVQISISRRCIPPCNLTNWFQDIPWIKSYILFRVKSNFCWIDIHLLRLMDRYHYHFTYQLSNYI